MTKLTVQDRKYAHFEYTPYLNKNADEVKRPENAQYDVGDIVYIKHSNSIGVVLGCISEDGGELRTDMDGMVCFDEVRPASIEDFKIKDVTFVKELFEDASKSHRTLVDRLILSDGFTKKVEQSNSEFICVTKGGRTYQNKFSVFKIRISGNRISYESHLVSLRNAGEAFDVAVAIAMAERRGYKEASQIFNTTT